MYKVKPLLSIFILAIASPGAANTSAQAQTSPNSASQVTPIPTLVSNVNGQSVALPDWSKVTWANMPPLNQAGNVQISSELVSQIGYDPSRSWTPNTPIDSVTMLGDLKDDFNVDSLSLNDLQKLSVAGSSTSTLDNLTLNDFGVLKNQTVTTLIKAIPTLGELDISQVKPLQDLAANDGISNQSGTVNELLQEHPELGTQSLTNLNLKQYQLSSIPGLETAPLKAFDKWQQSFIKDIPGLNQIPLAKLAPKLVSSLLGSAVAMADNYFSSVEHGDPLVTAQMFVSGKVTCSGKNIPVAVPEGKPYAYLELSDYLGKNGPSYGKRIASGDDQQVEGGCGPLAKIYGMEPTGWNAFGTYTFKLVLRDVDERTETANFWLYTGFCAQYPLIGKTCTARFLPVAPVFSVQHNDPVFLGIANQL